LSAAESLGGGGQGAARGWVGAAGVQGRLVGEERRRIGERKKEICALPNVRSNFFSYCLGTATSVILVYDYDMLQLLYLIYCLIARGIWV